MRATLVVIACILVLSLEACSTVPRVSNREKSQYALTWQNDFHVAGKSLAIVQPSAGLVDAVAQVWYQNVPALDKFPIVVSNDSAYIFFMGRFTQWARPYAIVKIWTKDDEVHEFDIGDPYVNHPEAIHGTKYKF